MNSSPSTYSTPITERPRAMPLWAYSERSFIICSGATYGMNDI